jgi:hypothetical protein
MVVYMAYMEVEGAVAGGGIIDKNRETFYRHHGSDHVLVGTKSYYRKLLYTHMIRAQ